MEYLNKLNLSPRREALYRKIMLEEEIDEAVLKLMDHPPIADDIAAETPIPLEVCRRLVDDARSELPRQDWPALPYSPPDERPPTSPSPACTDNSSSSSEDESDDEQVDDNYPRIRSPQALRQLVRSIHSAVDEAALAQTAREARIEAEAAALQEESDRLMAELKKKNELEKEKQQQV
jgi:hypothetical protein